MICVIKARMQSRPCFSFDIKQTYISNAVSHWFGFRFIHTSLSRVCSSPIFMCLSSIEHYSVGFIDRICPHKTSMINSGLYELFCTYFYKLINTSICFAQLITVPECLEGMLLWTICFNFIEYLVSKASVKVHLIILR